MLGAVFNAGNGMAGTQQAITSTLQTVFRMLNPASLSRRQVVGEIECSQSSVPNASTDCDVNWVLAACSAAGAGIATAITPYNTSGGPPDVAVTTPQANYTAEPTTYTQASEYFHRAVNQRGQIDWVGWNGGEIILPLTVSQGPGMRVNSPNYVGTVLCNMRFYEL